MRKNQNIAPCVLIQVCFWIAPDLPKSSNTSCTLPSFALGSTTWEDYLGVLLGSYLQRQVFVSGVSGVSTAATSPLLHRAMSGVAIAPAEQRTPGRVRRGTVEVTTPRAKAAAAPAGGAERLDKELEGAMAAARGALLRPKGTAGADRQAALAECRARFNAIERAFPAAIESADYFVTRARFEEFVGNYEAVADLYAAAAKNGAKPREVVQDNFIQFLARQSVDVFASGSKTAPAQKLRQSSEPRKARALPSTPSSAKRGPQVRAVHVTAV